ncbi:hypothetical protein PP7435_CHR1-0811 [Komagataella phaffii CBS 7435]|uniref:Transcription elongation factor S-II n=2 Tax=Komagataella phaffii TaxID=460519 RepID=C4QX96_KOMPG|nr:Transcription elongation factor S-II [Komagataella phaffii GS115]AOA61404.1 GQ67_02150T0 [Komagataella phaffii]CAH2446679.1 hypothetical protein BQ9382_C1-4255 [Komagataella phaffii CBS 7435]AOA66810.1 GQ68_02165T0 [Komagataella phaffii GS115]CAY67869.1 Transcription elongation factor S-II [Komagataella phaffii GS115]CCA36951.1 hypothetical protein PP7435_CHR1-0811 [Komagataella phaffii CBS 7435]
MAKSPTTGKGLKGVIRKRKLAKRNSNNSSVKTDAELEIEVARVRSACSHKIEEALRTRITDAQKRLILKKENEGSLGGVSYDITGIATAYERELYSKHNRDLKNYRTTFRKNLIAIKNQDIAFILDLLNGRICIKSFVNYSVEDLLSVKQKSIHKKLNQENLKHAISKRILPETINEIKSSFVVEKWGVSKSASAIED